jgi:hypothetical protein
MTTRNLHRTVISKLFLALLLALPCAALTACGSGVDTSASSSDDLEAAKKHACTTDANCSKGYVCRNGYCQKGPSTPPGGCSTNAGCPAGEVCVSGKCQSCTATSQCSSGEVCTGGVCTTPPPPPPGGCNTSHDCPSGGLCTSGQCVASACNHRASTKTGIRATVTITRYQGLIHGSNGDHEIAYGTLANVEWIHDPALKDSSSVQLAMNVSSNTDPTGLPGEVKLSVGQTIEVEGEYITAASASANGNAVIHFTHSTCGFADINGTTYQ